MKKNNFFWVSLSDLMISLFFVMMVLFIITMGVLHQREKVTREALEEIKNVQIALEGLDSKYFEFDDINKRYRLVADVQFDSNSDNINDIRPSERVKLINAGRNLYNKMKDLVSENAHIDYLLVIEGNTQRYKRNYLDNPDMGYKLSYKRALSLINFWESHNIDFRKLGPQCEIIIAGSGYFGHSRDPKNESSNRKFTIQVTSKVGKFLDKIN